MSYGLRIYSPTGAVRLDTTDRTLRVFATFTGSIPSAASSTQTVTHSLSGFNPSDTTIGIEYECSALMYLCSLVTTTNQLQLIRANDPSPFAASYQIKVFRL
jgi:hypothetical protein